jgi:hypothetical protein
MKEIEYFKHWHKYMGDICSYEECGYVLRDAESLFMFNDIFESNEFESLNISNPSGRNKANATHNIPYQVGQIEMIFNYYNFEFISYKEYRRRLIINGL